MMKKTTSQDVIKIVWKACDTFRGTMDSSKCWFTIKTDPSLTSKVDPPIMDKLS